MKKEHKKKPSDPLRIHLDASELIIFDNGETRLSGMVEFRRHEGLLVPKEIELRFVAGAVSKFEDSYQEIFLRGTDRFFDKKILLWNESSHLTSDLPKADDLLDGYSFPFGLQIPNTNPPSVKTDTVTVEYVLAAVVYFQDSCCFGWVPAFSPDPFVTKEVLSVRKVRSADTQFLELQRNKMHGVSLSFHPIPDAGPLDMNVIPLNVSGTDLIDVFGHVSCNWSPEEGIKITLPGCVSSSSTLVPIHVDASVTIQDLSISLIQKEDLEFKYNVDPSRPLGQDSLTNLKMKTKSEVLVLYTSTFENLVSGLHWISHSEPLSRSWDIFIEDMITKPAIIEHEFRIKIKFLDKEIETSTPVIVYNMPLFPDDETIVDSMSEMNCVAAARAAENDSEVRRREV